MEDILRNIENDIESASVEELRSLIPESFFRTCLPTVVLESGRFLYRGSEIGNFGDHRPASEISSFGMPPPQCRPQLGRANLEGEIVFYGGSSIACVEAENIRHCKHAMRPLEFLIAQWELQGDVEVLPCLDKDTYERITGKSLVDAFKNADYQKILSTLPTWDFLSDCFLKEGWDLYSLNHWHKITAIVASLLLAKTTRAICYRSVPLQANFSFGPKRSGQNELNFVLTKSLAADCLKLKRVYHTRQIFYTKKGKRRVGREWLRIGFPNSEGKIEYRQPSSCETDELLAQNTLHVSVIGY